VQDLVLSLDLPQHTATLSPEATVVPAPLERPIMEATSMPSGTKQANAALAALLGLTVMMIMVP
jgi:hypothetical protein